MIGTLYILSAPSGAGKTSLVNALIEADPNLTVSVSHTTRAPRSGEKPGEAYHFVTPEAFAIMQEAGEFLESATVFEHSYGTSRQAVEEQLAQGRDVILEIDWQGAEQVMSHRDCLSIFILPPSMEALAERLRGRGQDDEAVVAKRLAGAQVEMQQYAAYDYLVFNEDFKTALADLQAIIRASRCETARQTLKKGPLLSKLLPE